MRKTALARPK